MKKVENKMVLPADIDAECVDLCNCLNSLPTVMTTESCCGHCKRPFWVWFRCDSIPVLTRLGRAVSHNYSDGIWEIVVDTNDVYPYGFFWLRSKITFTNEMDMKESVIDLIKNINYWFDDKFDEHFNLKYE